MKLKLADYCKHYEKIVAMAHKAFHESRYAESFFHIDNASYLAQLINTSYKDDRLESLCGELSSRLIKKSDKPYTPVKDRFVFYDQIGTDVVLSVQYLRALISWEVDFLYILDAPCAPSPTILSELGSYPGAHVLLANGNIDDRTGNIQNIYDEIISYGAEKMFFHSPAYGALGVSLWHAIPEVARYRIVPGDHHFYLGTSVTDYAIEFRSFGATVAIEKRGFSRNQILIQPYYPIIKPVTYLGLPDSITDDNVLIFSGGAMYKVFSGDDTYFKICKRILDENPAAVILYAGDDLQKGTFDKLLNKYGISERFLFLGYRKDLPELMKHIDIYLGTYPTGGGLMMQYAALYAKPIVQFASKANDTQYLSSILGNSSVENIDISFYDIEELHAHLNQLVSDSDLRISVGFNTSKMLITPGGFNKLLHSSITGHPAFDRALETVDYSEVVNRNIDLLNNYLISWEYQILYRYRLKSMFLFPSAFFKAVTTPRILKAIFRRQKRRIINSARKTHK